MFVDHVMMLLQSVSDIWLSHHVLPLFSDPKIKQYIMYPLATNFCTFVMG